VILTLTVPLPLPRAGAEQTRAGALTAARAGGARGAREAKRAVAADRSELAEPITACVAARLEEGGFGGGTDGEKVGGRGDLVGASAWAVCQLLQAVHKPAAALVDISAGGARLGGDCSSSKGRGGGGGRADPELLRPVQALVRRTYETAGPRYRKLMATGAYSG
jgi:hypothetical protein